MMYLMIDIASDFDFAVVAGIYFAIGFTVLCVLAGITEAIIDGIERKREKQRRACKRYDVTIRPARRY